MENLTGKLKKMKLQKQEVSDGSNLELHSLFLPSHVSHDSHLSVRKGEQPEAGLGMSQITGCFKS